MDWYSSVVVIRAGDRVGTGVLLEPSTVLTAAHVVAPGGGQPPAGDLIVVEIPWLSYAQSPAQTVRVHPDWAPGVLDADFATLRISPAKGLGLTTGAPNTSTETYLYGFPAGTDPAQPQSSYQAGFLQNDGLKLFSDGFHVLSGMSGSPFVQMSGGITRVVGLATWDADSPTAGGFKGLPISSSYFSGVWPMPSSS